MTAKKKPDNSDGAELDDTSDKLRRNVVLISTGIIAASALGLKLVQHGSTELAKEPTLAGIFTITSPYATEIIWFFALFTLFYVFGRYWCVSQTKLDTESTAN